MKTQRDHLPIEILFNLLNAYRKNIDVNAGAIRKATLDVGLQSLSGGSPSALPVIPRISFWIRLAQAASLLDETPYPTLFVEEWLGWPYYGKLTHLLSAWLQVPGSDKNRRVRAKLLERLGQGYPLTGSYRNYLAGLQALRICEGEYLSVIGRELLKPTGHHVEDDPLSKNWRLENGKIVVPFPPDWKLAWQLGAYLDPIAPGVYLLDGAKLREAAQRAAAHRHPGLTVILEEGLGAPAATRLDEIIGSMATIQILAGPVLEFSDQNELKELRQSASMRDDLSRLLSPRHVALDPWIAPKILRKFVRMGYLCKYDFSYYELPTRTPKSGNGLSQSERTYLLSLMLLAEGLQKAGAPPPGLFFKLVEPLNHPLRAAAARQATRMHQAVQIDLESRTETTWEPEPIPPPTPPEELITFIQQTIDHHESIDIYYQASGRHTAEYRHITPLLLEERYNRYYLIAYCHLRRDNRTFRLDRLELLTVPPH